MNYYKRHGRCLIQHLALLTLLALPVVVWSTSEVDLAPGPPAQAAVDPAVTRLDTPTKQNTVDFPAPLSRSVREPAINTQTQPSGVLSGRIVYTSPGHGWAWDGSVWRCGRGNSLQIVEDLGNHDQFTYYCYYLFNAGATVVPMRPIGNQTNEVILDNDSPGVTFSGTWSNSASNIYYGQGGDAVSYRFSVVAPVETAVASYRPNIPAPGFYPIYTWALNSGNRAPDQLYRIHHSGGISEVRIDHVKVGRGWVYLGTYYLEAGTDAYVEISNESAGPVGRNVIADAIRFGNGIGDINRGGGASGFPREDEGSRYWAQNGIGQGGDTSVYDRLSLSDSDDNVGTPPRMASYMNNEAEGAMTDRLYIGIHSNAAGDRGALGLYNTASSAKTPNQQALATIFGAEVNNDMRALGSPPLPVAWVATSPNALDRGDIDFGEIRWDTIGNEMDATIIETAYHDDTEDALIMRDPFGRQAIARSILHATIKYFSTFGGGTAVFPPNAPLSPKIISNGNGTATISWTAPAVDPTGSGLPTDYVIYRSSNGYGFGNPTSVGNVNQHTLTDIPAGQTVYFRVSARNAAGESFPTETLAVRVAQSSINPVLIVNGFDRLDSAMNVRETRPIVGTHDRVKPWKSNNFDYVVQHAKALEAAGRYFDSAANETLSEAMLAPYQALVWIAGEESTADETFNNAEQVLVSNFLTGAKGIFVSGSEIGWDLEAQSGGQGFYNNSLLTDYVIDDAATYAISAADGIFSSIGAFAFGPTPPINNTVYPPTGFAFYDADYPDTINPFAGTGSRVLTYSTGGGAAVAGETTICKVVSFGFPFENITSDAARNQIMDASMAFLGVANTGVSDWSLYEK